MGDDTGAGVGARLQQPPVARVVSLSPSFRPPLQASRCQTVGGGCDLRVLHVGRCSRALHGADDNLHVRSPKREAGGRRQERPRGGLA